MNALVGKQAMTGEGITRATRAELVALRGQLPKRLAAPMDRLHSQRAGTHASVMRGRGMDYRESRAYQPGDDVRRMDWRLTARSGRMHTKLFQEEREQSLLIVLDTNVSMQFGTRRRFKVVQGARAAAMAAWLGVATGMRVGLELFGVQDAVVRPSAGTRGALAVIQALGGETRNDERKRELSMSAALQRISRLARGGSQVLLISDGGSMDDAVRSSLVALRKHAHVRVLVVADALENALAPPGRYPLAWQGGIRTVDLGSRKARVHLRERLGRDPHRLQQLAGELGLPVRRIDTACEPLQAVAQLMGIRLGGRGR